MTGHEPARDYTELARYQRAVEAMDPEGLVTWGAVAADIGQWIILDMGADE